MKLRIKEKISKETKTHRFTSLWNWKSETDLMDTEGMKMSFSLMTNASRRGKGTLSYQKYHASTDEQFSPHEYFCGDGDYIVFTHNREEYLNSLSMQYYVILSLVQQ
ncbi:hypothetical protein TSUD_48190 [Trifolium subterraneum]|nr:hypothetical protein TSUD_48190 [Trifolium subterraneum]